MERKWLEKFYTECGREVALAYNVLNYTNNWGITLVMALIGVSFINSAPIQLDGAHKLAYPTLYHWFYTIIAWIVMLRFFSRSALALANMYRWNALIYATSKVLSLPSDHPVLPIYERNCAKKIDGYFYDWKSAIKKRKLIWRNLKLMYIWFFLIVLTLFVWGLYSLEHNFLYWLGLSLFFVATFIECYFFMTGYGLQYKKLYLEEEPEISKIWEKLECKNPKAVVFGFCENGPYKHATDLLKNNEVRWIPWSYHSSNIDGCVLNDFISNSFQKHLEVLFTSWPEGHTGEVTILRKGKIDHISTGDGIVRMTIFLEPRGEEIKHLKVKLVDKQIFCFYIT